MDDKIKRLVLKLTEKTVSAGLDWGKTSRDNEFICSVGNASLTVDKYWARNEWGEEDECVVDICILNSAGQQIDRYYCTDNEIAEFRLMEALHGAAHRRHYKIDEVIDEIIVSLDRIGE